MEKHNTQQELKGQTIAGLTNSDTIQNQNKHKGNEQTSDYLEIGEVVINIAEHQTKNKQLAI